MILVDTGPLVAIADRDDSAHERCVAALKELTESTATVWPVVTEAMYFLRRSQLAQELLWDLLETGGLVLLSMGPEDFPRMRELMSKYRDLPMDLADAALVRVAERDNLRRVFTLDHRDFRIYRPKGLPRFTIVP